MSGSFVIGIAGGTGSGKTTLAERFVARTAALHIAHDRYYRTGPPDTNFDHPDAVETTLLVEHLAALQRGEAIDLPDYDFATHTRIVGKRVRPRPIIVVEGILALADEALRACFDVSVFVRCPDDIRLLRRILRDCAQRGRTLESVAGQYLATVRPMHERYVAPCEALADLVLDGMGDPDAEVERLVTRAS